MVQKFGDPFGGEDLERLRSFLADQGISYDEGVEHTVVLEDGGRIVATGSVQANVVKCVAVDEGLRGQNLLGQVMTHLVEWLFGRGVTHYFGYTKPANERIFQSLGLHPVVRTQDVLLLENRPAGLDRWLAKVSRATAEALAGKGVFAGKVPAGGTAPVDDSDATAGANPLVGAIVMNANPFTLGHRHLVREASSQVDLLHVFVLSSEQPFMPARDRVGLVREGTADLPNVLVHEGGPYLVSPATFPTYFMRGRTEQEAYQANCLLDVTLFRDRVAPALGISRRFVGTEPLCPVTACYNHVMARELPLKGIDLVEVPRLEAPAGAAGNPSSPISASRVRELFAAGDLDALRDLVPACTYGYLCQKAGR